MTSRASDRFISVTLSVLLHGSIVGLLVYGWWRFQHRPQPVAAMAIDATVVSASALHPGSHSRAPASAPAAAVPPPPPPPAPPPQVAEDQTVVRPPDTAARERAAQEQAARDAAAQHDAELKAQKLAQQQADELAQQQARDQAAAQQAQADAERKAQEAARAARAEAERKTREAAERKAKAEAERLAKIEAAKQAAEQKRKAAAAAAAAASQADLQRSLAEEEHFDAARASGAMATWEQQIQARIQQAWIRPPSARPGISCTLLVTQVPGGEITNVTLGSCNGDEAVRESIETAAYRASPLPPPPDPSLFERNLEITFKPTDQ